MLKTVFNLLKIFTRALVSSLAIEPLCKIRGKIAELLKRSIKELALIRQSPATVSLFSGNV